MPEHTEIVFLDLPEGQDYAWFAELDIVGLSRRLDAAGRERALDELQAEWRAQLPPVSQGSPPARGCPSAA